VEQEAGMKTLRRKLIVSSVQYGTPVGGRCSVCHKRIDVELGDSEVLSEAQERLLALFEEHVCSEPSGYLAPQLVHREQVT
jgi:hypothetical protein